MKQVFTIHVTLHDTIEMTSADHTVRMIRFGGNCDSDFFKGNILEGGVDTQIITADGTGTLSARYILEGTDCEGCSCRIFIENNGKFAPGEPTVTTPVIYTDSNALKWIETAVLTGTVLPADGGVTVAIYAEEN